jgi:hypothetical protein
MKLAWKIIWFAGCIAGAAQTLATPVTQVPNLEYSQDGVIFAPFAAIAGKAKSGTYYDYHNASGHPGFGTAKALTSTAVYWDSRHELLSMILIAGTPGDGKGEIRVTIEDLPDTAALSVADDRDEFKYKHGKPAANARFRFNKGTDGLVLGGLADDSMAIKIAVNPVKQMDQWRLVSGDGTNIDLDFDKPLFLRVAEVSSEPPITHHHHHTTSSEPPAVIPPTSGSGGNPGAPLPVPEPGAGILILSLSALWTLRRQR